MKTKQEKKKITKKYPKKAFVSTMVFLSDSTPIDSHFKELFNEVCNA